MDVTALFTSLALVTLLGVALFALISKEKVERRRRALREGRIGKSTLAEDAPNRVSDRGRDEAHA